MKAIIRTRIFTGALRWIRFWNNLRRTPHRSPPAAPAQSYGVAADIWSAGVVLRELLLRRPPYFDLPVFRAMYLIRTQVRLAWARARSCLRAHARACLHGRVRDRMHVRRRARKIVETQGARVPLHRRPRRRR